MLLDKFYAIFNFLTVNEASSGRNRSILWSTLRVLRQILAYILEICPFECMTIWNVSTHRSISCKILAIPVFFVLLLQTFSEFKLFQFRKVMERMRNATEPVACKNFLKFKKNAKIFDWKLFSTNLKFF